MVQSKLEQIDLVEQLQTHAIYSPKQVAISPIASILMPYELKQIGVGMNARVFKVVGTDWVVKEGRWDMQLVLPAGASVSMPVQLLKKGMDVLSFAFFPDPEEVARQYRQYLNLVEYMGYFGRQAWYRRSYKDYYHPNIDLIIAAQKAIRSSLSYFIPQLEEFYRCKFEPNLAQVLAGKVKQHNFLPAEYLLYGKAISPENKGKQTYFIFQKFVAGTLLHDIPLAEWTLDLKQQMVLFAYLLLLMDYQLGIIPDTRPRNYTELINWLSKTDNMIISKHGAKFIDTRWYWETRSLNPTRRGIIISDLALNAYKKAINQILITI